MSVLQVGAALCANMIGENKLKKAILIALSACAMSAPAYAQDDASLGGAKVGVVAGYDSVKLSLDGDSASKGGFAYGLTAGYDFDLGNAVVGIEAELADSTAKETVTDILEAGDEASIAASRDLYVGARVGFAASSNLVVYAKGGYTNVRVKARYADSSGSFSDSDTLDGFRVGAGVELVGQTNFARLEYRYSDYGKYSYDNVDTGISASRHQVVVTGGFRF